MKDITTTANQLFTLIGVKLTGKSLGEGSQVPNKGIIKKNTARAFLLKCLLIVAGLIFELPKDAFAQPFTYDLGNNNFSTLKWKQFATTGIDGTAATIGLTTDGKVYVWGENGIAEIHTNKTAGSGALAYNIQATPYYRSMPNGQPVTKVAVSYSYGSVSFVALSQSGTLYGWGMNPNGLLGNGWTVSTTTTSDTSRIKRIPQVITLPGETSVLDFSMQGPNGAASIVMLGGSGKAYVRGYYAGSTYTTTALQIPFPAGVTGYKRVWMNSDANGTYMAFLLGTDDKLYVTGQSYARTNAGTLELNDPTNVRTSAFNFSTDIPKLVPLPADVAVKEVYVGNQVSFVMSTTGRVFGAGTWYSNRSPYLTSGGLPGLRGTYLFPLKNVPAISGTLSTTANYVSDVYRYTNSPDTLLFTNKFLELPLPAGAQSFKNINIDAMRNSQPANVNFIDNNNKVWWRGSTGTVSDPEFQNYLQYVGYGANYCQTMDNYQTKTPYAFVEEAINLTGSEVIHYNRGVGFVISTSGRGYVYGGIPGSGNIFAVYGLGKAYNGAIGGYPIPIANEQIDLCNPSPGTGGGSTSGPAVGTLDCSKTQIVAAPVSGTPSQHALVVTVNVTTAGSFSPLSVSGSGMSLANGVTSVTTALTGVQQFQIPINYDGTALTNNFQFTIGQAGSCTADLTLQSKTVVKNVFTLQNCTAITPGVLSK